MEPRVQVDVAAVNWRQKAILLGECKWGTDQMGQGIVRELVEKKSPLVLRDLPAAGEGWKVHYAFFAQAGFTKAARAEAERHGAVLVDLARLDQDLRVSGH